MFISLIGALASSCLAIIFPAIIQTCTFWSWPDGDEHDDDDGDNGDNGSDANRADARESAAPGAVGASCGCRRNLPAAKLNKASLLLNCRDCKRIKRRKWRKSLAWHLFVLKNAFLVLFGVLGLITGTWVSLRQLGAAGGGGSQSV